MVSGLSVEIMIACCKCEGKGLTGASSMYHCTKGIGLPVALQNNIGKLLTMETIGQSKEMNKTLS